MQELEDIRHIFESLFGTVRTDENVSPSFIGDTLIDLYKIGYLKLSQVIPM